MRRHASDRQGAIDDETRAIELSPSSDEYWYDRAVAREDNRDLGAALDYEKSLELAPSGPRAAAARAAVARLR